MFPLVLASSTALTTLPNVQYLVNGYDVVSGNPQPSGSPHDLGYRQQVFKLTFANFESTDDHKWGLPDGFTGNQARKCSLSSEVSGVFGQTSYFDSLSSWILMRSGAAYEPGAFSASSDYKRVTNATYNAHRVAFEATAVCSEYTLQRQSFTGPAFTSNFADAISLLAHNPHDATTADAVIAAFGTHVISQALVGAKTSIQSVFSLDFYMSTSDRFSFKNAASYGFAVFTGSTAGLTVDQVSQGVTYNNGRNESYQSILGERTPTNGNTTGWQFAVSQNPFPYELTLMPLHELLESTNFPTLSPANLTIARATLGTAISSWCRTVKGVACETRKPDPAPIESRITLNSGNKEVTFPCPSGILLSVGVAERRVYAQDKQSIVQPWLPSYHVKKGWPTCSTLVDAEALSCAALCSNSVTSSVVVTAPAETGVVGKGVQTAYCPEGHVVSSCGMWTDGSLNETSPMSYPVLPNACACKNVQCIAICVPERDVPSHQIVSKHGGGTTRLTCPEGKHVLGCGYRTDEGSTSQSYWDVSTTSRYECKMDSSAATLYAICASYV